jgi:CBS domain-containing membrane protein
MRVNVQVKDPLHNPLFRLVRGVSHFQLRTALRHVDDAKPLILIYAMTCGAVALGIITLVSMWTRMPLLFPPLAPSAFILFTTPLSPAGSPRNLILGHSSAVAIGLLVLHGANLLWPEAALLDSASMGVERIATLIVAMGLITALMILIHCHHPPAAASTTIAAMGFLDPLQALGLVLAAILLAGQATVMVRGLAGLPYPLWRADEKAVRCYGELAGLSTDHEDRWQRLREITFKTRKV